LNPSGVGSTGRMAGEGGLEELDDDRAGTRRLPKARSTVTQSATSTPVPAAHGCCLRRLGWAATRRSATVAGWAAQRKLGSLIVVLSQVDVGRTRPIQI
jgi:hypothetical protein